MIYIKRIYNPVSANDGQRFLVDRLWPRGLQKDALKLDGWFKEAAPSNELRHWFGHDPDKWCEFNARYFAELDSNPTAWKPLLNYAKEGDITLLFSSREEKHNNAVTLRAYLEKKLKTS